MICVTHNNSVIGCFKLFEQPHFELISIKETTNCQDHKSESVGATVRHGLLVPRIAVLIARRKWHMYAEVVVSSINFFSSSKLTLMCIM